MKRFISLALALALVCSLAACGGSDTPAPASGPASAPAAGTPADSAPAEPEAPASGDVALVGEQVLLDDAGIKVTATSLGYTEYAYDMNGESRTRDVYALQLKMENHSGQDLIPTGYSVCDGTFNGVMAGMVYEEQQNPGAEPRLEDGAEEDWVLKIIPTSMDGSIDGETLPLPLKCQVQVEFSTVTDDGYTDSLYVAGPLTELVTTASDPNATFELLSGMETYTDENLTVAVSGIFYDDTEAAVEGDYDAYRIDMYVRNDTDETLCFTPRVLHVNGREFEHWAIGYTKILPGSVCRIGGFAVAWALREMGINSYEDIESIELVLDARHEGDYALESEPVFTTEPFTLDRAWIGQNYTSASRQSAE